eukprot:jgi/Psemu1/39366/gm1.39366_g
MPTEEPPNIPVARRTRSHTSLGTDSARDFTPTARRTHFSQQETTDMTIPLAPPPIDRREDPFPSFDKPMATILLELFAVFKEPDSLLWEALKNSNILTWARFLQLRDFDDLTYRNRNEYKQLPRYMHQELHLLATFSAQLKDQGKDLKDHTLYTSENCFAGFEFTSRAQILCVILTRQYFWTP